MVGGQHSAVSRLAEEPLKGVADHSLPGLEFPLALGKRSFSQPGHSPVPSSAALLSSSAPSPDLSPAAVPRPFSVPALCFLPPPPSPVGRQKKKASWLPAAPGLPLPWQFIISSTASLFLKSYQHGPEHAEDCLPQDSSHTGEETSQSLIRCEEKSVPRVFPTVQGEGGIFIISLTEHFTRCSLQHGNSGRQMKTDEE